jgi:T-complex protein 1 subunit zeta
VVAGAGAFEVAASCHLTSWMKTNVSGKAKLGVQAFADALLIVPRTLAENSGLDQQETLLKVVEAHERTGENYGVDVITGEATPTAQANIYDNYIVKRQFLNIAPVLAE